MCGRASSGLRRGANTNEFGCMHPGRFRVGEVEADLLVEQAEATLAWLTSTSVPAPQSKNKMEEARPLATPPSVQQAEGSVEATGVSERIAVALYMLAV